MTAKKVNIVSKETNIFDNLSKALYLPINNINPHITNTMIDKSIFGKFENNGIFVKRFPDTMLTAAIVKVPVIKLTIRKIGRYKEFLFLKPSKSDIPVDAVKRVPTSKNGYFRRFIISIRPTKENPNLAPAVVDDIRWEPPIAAPAKIIPGPIKFWSFELNKGIFFCINFIFSPLN